jgi:hypothetical protein
MRRTRRVAVVAVVFAVIGAVGIAIGGSTFGAHPLSSHAATVPATPLKDVRASTSSDSRARVDCIEWLDVGGGGPADATLTSAMDATASQVRALLVTQHVDAGSESNLSALAPTEYAAICVFDVSMSNGLGGAKRLVAYATPENQGIGLIALD